MTSTARIYLVLLGLAAGVPVAAQDATPPATPASDTPLMNLVNKFKEPDQGGGYHLTDHFALVFGGIKPGSSAASGVALSDAFDDGGFVQAKAEYSLRQFALLQFRYDTPKLLDGRVMLSSRMRWQVAPELSLFKLGPDAPPARADYSERKTEVSTALTAQLAPCIRATLGFGLERYGTSSGSLDLSEDESLPSVPDTPGLGTRPWFTHTMAGLAYDSRPAGYARAGSLVEARAHFYSDRHDGFESFQEIEASGQQLLPTGSRGFLDLNAHVWTSHAAAGHIVPFFLMPTLGGGDYLEGYRLYRFRDRNALILSGEYRWPVHEMVDVAALYEGGKVEPSATDLDLRGLQRDVAIGVRIHSKTADLLRLDVGHSHEGYTFVIGFNALK